MLEGKLRDTLLRECHDGPLAGHGGAKRTTTFLKKSYYWPNLKDCAEEYVKTCLTCQQNRTLNKKQAGLLQPLSIPEGPWATSLVQTSSRSDSTIGSYELLKSRDNLGTISGLQLGSPGKKWNFTE